MGGARVAEWADLRAELNFRKKLGSEGSEPSIWGFHAWLSRRREGTLGGF